MGREIRRVPANWEHPRKEFEDSPWAGGCDYTKAHNGKCYQPMYDQDFDSALSEWISEYELWKKGEHPDQLKYSEDANEPYWEYAGLPPDPRYYRPKWEKADWYQVYETVSEGTPVTPPFATKDELIDYLVKNGDFWDQRRGHGGWKRGNAEKFVGQEWAPFGMIIVENGSSTMKAPRDGI